MCIIKKTDCFLRFDSHSVELNMKKSFHMSIACGIVGLIAGLSVSFNAIGAGYRLFPLFSVTSSILCSFFLWYLLVVRRNSNTISYGIFVGILIVILSHYFTWYIMSLYYFFCNQIMGKCLSSLGEATMNPIQSLYMLLPFTMLSLVIAWITLPLGAFLGAIVIKLQSNHL